MLSLCIYPDTLVMIADNKEVTRHARCFNRYQVMYD